MREGAGVCCVLCFCVTLATALITFRGVNSCSFSLLFLVCFISGSLCRFEERGLGWIGWGACIVIWKYEWDKNDLRA